MSLADDRGGLMLADGAYIDLAPVDIARKHAPTVVIETIRRVLAP